MEGRTRCYAPLIDGCLKEERRAQQRVYELFYGKMMAVCLRYTKNTDQAKDILQDGFIKVFKSVDKFNRAGSFEGWIRRIMVNTAIDHFRRTKNSYLLLVKNGASRISVIRMQRISWPKRSRMIAWT